MSGTASLLWSRWSRKDLTQDVQLAAAVFAASPQIPILT